MNLVIQVGRIANDLELKVKNNLESIRFTLAVDMSYKNNDGQKVEKTQWTYCVAYGRLAKNISAFCKKGSKILIEGQINSYRIGQDEPLKDITEVVAKKFQALSNLKEKDESNAQLLDADDLPF